jgi:threonine/homoserine/homoserine lactone efflux protein
MNHLLAFSALVAVLVAIPGPAVVLIMKNAVLHGRPAAVRTACGVYSGDLVWVAASAAGLTTVLAASRPAFETLRYVGAAYLIYLGIRLVISGAHVSAPDQADSSAAPARSTGRAFGQGVLCELSNPKTLLVFTSVIPQFLPTSAGVLAIIGYGVLFATLGFVSLAAYAVALSAARRAVRRPKLTDGLTRGSGGLLVAFGAGLAVEHAG